MFILLSILSFTGNAACVSQAADTSKFSGRTIYKQVCTVELQCNSGLTSCSLVQDTTAPYSALNSQRPWGNLFWDAHVFVKSASNFTATVTVPKTGLLDKPGTIQTDDNLDLEYAKDYTVSCNYSPSVANSYVKCIDGQYPILDPSATLTVTYTKPSNVVSHGKLILTGWKTDISFIDDLNYTKTFMAKTYSYRGWPDFHTGVDQCRGLSKSYGQEMCAASLHSAEAHALLVGVQRTEGYSTVYTGAHDGLHYGKTEEHWQYSDGSEMDYNDPWVVYGPKNTWWEGRNLVDRVRSSHMYSGSPRLVAFAGNPILANSHICGGSTSVRTEYTSVNCDTRLPMACQPCMFGGAKRNHFNVHCDDCVYMDGKKCFTKEFCHGDRSQPKEYPIYLDPSSLRGPFEGVWVRTILILLILSTPCICNACYKYVRPADKAEDE